MKLKELTDSIANATRVHIKEDSLLYVGYVGNLASKAGELLERNVKEVGFHCIPRNKSKEEIDQKELDAYVCADVWFEIYFEIKIA